MTPGTIWIIGWLITSVWTAITYDALSEVDRVLGIFLMTAVSLAVWPLIVISRVSEMIKDLPGA